MAVLLSWVLLEVSSPLGSAEEDVSSISGTAAWKNFSNASFENPLPS